MGNYPLLKRSAQLSYFRQLASTKPP